MSNRSVRVQQFNFLIDFLEVLNMWGRLCLVFIDLQKTSDARCQRLL